MSKLYLVNNGIYHKCGTAGCDDYLFCEFYLDNETLKCARAFGFGLFCSIEFPMYLSIGYNVKYRLFKEDKSKKYYIIGNYYYITYKDEYEKFVIDV